MISFPYQKEKMPQTPHFVNFTPKTQNNQAVAGKNNGNKK